jgi:flagellar basal-body rod modification protein FlgD
MTSSINNTSASTGNTVSSQNSGSSSTAAATDSSMVSENTFLKLLVAQLQNQDPESPQDPSQFVGELAQFSELEQSLQMRQDLDSISSIVQTNAAALSSSGGTTSNTTQTASTGTTSTNSQ